MSWLPWPKRPLAEAPSLAHIRALYGLERGAKEKRLTGSALAAYRQEHSGPILATFAAWLADQHGRPATRGR